MFSQIEITNKLLDTRKYLQMFMLQKGSSMHNYKYFETANSLYFKNAKADCAHFSTMVDNTTSTHIGVRVRGGR